MKYRNRITASLLALLMASNAFANTNEPQCPTIDAVRNSLFVVSGLIWEPSQWMAVSNPVRSVDDSEWNITATFLNKNITTQTEALDYINQEIKTASLIGPELEYEQDKPMCVYTKHTGKTKLVVVAIGNIMDTTSNDWIRKF